MDNGLPNAVKPGNGLPNAMELEARVYWELLK